VTRRGPSVRILVKRLGKYSLPDEQDAVVLHAGAPLAPPGSHQAAVDALRASGVGHSESSTGDMIFVTFAPREVTEEQAIGVVAGVMRDGGVRVTNLRDALAAARRHAPTDDHNARRRGG
jgi:hypothetical protein